MIFFFLLEFCTPLGACLGVVLCLGSPPYIGTFIVTAEWSKQTFISADLVGSLGA